MKIVSSPLCTFCHTSEKSLEHLFCYCEHSITFWTLVDFGTFINFNHLIALL